jgi:hypothetical protein
MQSSYYKGEVKLCESGHMYTSCLVLGILMNMYVFVGDFSGVVHVILYFKCTVIYGCSHVELIGPYGAFSCLFST